MDASVLLAIGGGAVAVVFAGLLTAVVLRKPPGNERMIDHGGEAPGLAAFFSPVCFVVNGGRGIAKGGAWPVSTPFWTG